MEKLKTKKRKGFTLMELVIVCLIVAVLALIAVPNLIEATSTANISRFKSNCKSLTAAYGEYIAANNGERPTAISQLDDYVDMDTDVTMANDDEQYTIAGSGDNTYLLCAIQIDDDLGYKYYYPGKNKPNGENFEENSENFVKVGGEVSIS